METPVTTILTHHNALAVALRSLNASCIDHQKPDPADEAYLRRIANDYTTPFDDLACDLIQVELRLQKKAMLRNRLPHRAPRVAATAMG